MDRPCAQPSPNLALPGNGVKEEVVLGSGLEAGSGLNFPACSQLLDPQVSRTQGISPPGLQPSPELIPQRQTQGEDLGSHFLIFPSPNSSHPIIHPGSVRRVLPDPAHESPSSSCDGPLGRPLGSPPGERPADAMGVRGRWDIQGAESTDGGEGLSAASSGKHRTRWSNVHASRRPLGV